MGMLEIDFQSLPEFDGTTVLCRVCGDKASGFHYGVHSCEGCKGFFRRSIQQKIQYRPCTKNQQCSILRINRNRCQYCRLKKCIAVGMSRDAVRFGRVPKREKAKIMAAMQSVASRSVEKALSAELEDEARLVNAIVCAHAQTCEFTREKITPLLHRVRINPPPPQPPVYNQPIMACPLNPHSANGGSDCESAGDFTERFSPAIRGVVEFAKRIPGFGLLQQDDQVTLLKAGVFEVLLVRLATMFDSQSNTMLCVNGQVVRRDTVAGGSNARFLLDSMFEFADRLNALQLSDPELGLFSATVLIISDRPGLRSQEMVERMHNTLSLALSTIIAQNHPDQPDLYDQLRKIIPDLRTLNTLHSEKLLAFKGTHVQQQPMQQQPPHMWQPPQQLVDGMSRSLQAHLYPADNNLIVVDDCVKSPISSVCSGESVCSVYLKRRRPTCDGGSSDEASNHHTDVNPTDNNSGKCPYKSRKLDSPTDSGIESGNEKFEKMSCSTCSSPRSSLDEKVRDVVELDSSEIKQETSIDDMPVLKKALQAPPLVNTNSLMEEAYRSRPPKKYHTMKKESIPESSTQGFPDSTHSTLAKSLMEAPKLSAEQLKRQDMIHSMIMRTGDLEPPQANFYIPSSWPSTSSCGLGQVNSTYTVQSVVHSAPLPIPSSSTLLVPYGRGSSPKLYSQYPPQKTPSQHVFELQVDSQPLNLSKKTPPPPNIKLEA